MHVRNAIIYSRLRLGLDEDRGTLFKRFEQEHDDGMPDGVGAWQSLCSKYERTGEAQIARLHRKFHDATLEGIKDPDLYFARVDPWLSKPTGGDGSSAGQLHQLWASQEGATRVGPTCRWALTPGGPGTLA